MSESVFSVPTVKQCFDIIERFEMLDNIKAHSIQVAQVARTLLEHLPHPDNHPLTSKRLLELTVSGALLHDIAKTKCLKTGGRHAREGRTICAMLGYPEIGEIVAEHVILSDFKSGDYRAGIFGPKELVYYADKRVLHDGIVTLDKRLDYILERYGSNDPVKKEHIRKNFEQAVSLEGYLFEYIPFSSNELNDYVTNAPL